MSDQYSVMSQEQLLTVVQSLEAEVERLTSLLDYHVHEPVDDDSPVQELGSRLADLLQADDWNNIEPILNGLDEHCRKNTATIERLRGALRRLASPEAFWLSRAIGQSEADRELLLRMQYAEDALEESE